MNKRDIIKFVKNETEQLVKRRKLLRYSNSRDELNECSPTGWEYYVLALEGTLQL